MRIIVMGTGPFAVPACRRILADGHDIPLCVTRPLPEPPPKKLPERPVFDWATSESIELFEPQSINDPAAIEKLRGYEADLFFVCDYGQILSSEALTAARLGGVNLHGSLLPRHRGAAPVQWALLRGDTAAGVTVIHMTPRLDAGPALTMASTLIEPHETAEQLEPRLADLGIAATMDAIAALDAWDGQSQLGQIQEATEVTRAPRFAKHHGSLDPRLPADYLVRLYRACQPWPGTFVQLTKPGGKLLRLIVRGATACPSLPVLKEQEVGQAVGYSGPETNDQPVLAIQCNPGVLLVNHIQPAGKRPMSAEEFIRGHGETFCAELPDPPAVQLDVQ
ncbi:MAG TPA: methionyl-tRNA formyltransferase [Planctomycetaceae bacterium]|nr:methionyl-tRNA formyltransferase [Planctomycetaceae bacterium]